MEHEHRTVNLTIHDEKINEGALDLLQVIRPHWHTDNIHFKLLTDGITNKLVRCWVKGDPEEESVLVRIYGNKTEMLIDRKAEKRNILLLNKVNLAPRLYACFDNGLAYQFVPGCTLSEKSVRRPEIYKLIARRMARLHKVAGEKEEEKLEPILWTKLDDFFNLVPESFTKNNVQQSFLDNLPSKSRLRKEIDQLKIELTRLGSPLVFAHNDLLLGNVVYDETRREVVFIDFEYAAPNYQAFDIGNHFAEFVGIENVDYDNYPDREFQFEWLREYARVSNGNEPTERELETLYVQVNKFTLASHLFWGIWALIQAEHSYIEFDFIGYAAIRLNEYFAKKEPFLALEVPQR